MEFLKFIIAKSSYYISQFKIVACKLWRNFLDRHFSMQLWLQTCKITWDEFDYLECLKYTLSRVLFIVYLRFWTMCLIPPRLAAIGFVRVILFFKQLFRHDPELYPASMDLWISWERARLRLPIYRIKTPELLLNFLKKKGFVTNRWFFKQTLLLFDFGLDLLVKWWLLELKEHKRIRNERFKIIDAFYTQKKKEEPIAVIFAWISLFFVSYQSFYIDCTGFFLIQPTIDWSAPDMYLYIFFFKLSLSFILVLFSRSLAPRYHIEKLVEVFWKKKILIFTALFILVFIILTLVL